MQIHSSSYRKARRPQRSVPRLRAQRGVTLLFALVTLVALLFATLALVRSVDTSTLLMGNLGFKQDATVTADQATRQALVWLTANNAALNSDLPQNGYYASTKELQSDGTTIPVDVTGQQLTSVSSRQIVDWTNTCSATSTSYICSTSTSTSANSSRFVVFRLCSLAGDQAAATYTGTCAKPLSSSGQTASKRGELNYSESGRFTGGSGPYYRIVVRVQGARNTTSFTETIVHF